MWSMCVFFVHCYVASKIETKEKMEEKVRMRLNSSLKHWLMVWLNLSTDDVANCKEKTFVKERNFDLAYKKGLSFEKSKERDKFRASKTRKSVRKAFKTRSGDIF